MIINSLAPYTNTTMMAIESMEDQLAQVPTLVGGSECPSSLEPARLPRTLLGEDAEVQQSHPIMGDSVTSPMHWFPKEGCKLSPSLALSPIKVHVQGAEPEYTSHSRAAPATRMVSHMGAEDTNPLAARTSGVTGTAGGAVMGVEVG